MKLKLKLINTMKIMSPILLYTTALIPWLLREDQKLMSKYEIIPNNSHEINIYNNEYEIKNNNIEIINEMSNK